MKPAPKHDTDSLDSLKAIGANRALVFAAIRGAADQYGRCYVKPRDLAVRAGISVDLFNYHVAVLRRRGDVSTLYDQRLRPTALVIRRELRP